MTTISTNHIARAVYEAVKDKSHAEQAPVFKNTARFLARKKLLAKSENILAALARIIDTEENRLRVKVSSAKKLGENKKHELAAALQRRYGAEKIFWDESIDENLLDGFRLTIGDEVVDLSAKHKIKQLREYLIKE